MKKTNDIPVISEIPDNYFHDLEINHQKPSIKLTKFLISGFIENSFMYNLFMNGISTYELHCYQKILGLSDHAYITMVKLTPNTSNILTNELFSDYEIIKRLKQRLSENCIHCIGPMMANRICVLISPDELFASHDLTKAYAMNLAKQMKEVLETATGYSCKIGIGSPVTLNYIYKSYLEALHAMQIDCSSNIVHTYDNNILVNNEISEYSEIEKRLLDAIQSHKEDASFYFSQLMAHLSLLDANAKRNHVLKLMVLVSNVMSSKSQNAASYTEYMDMAKELIAIPDDEIIEWALQKFHATTNIVRCQRVADLTNRIVVITKDYLEEHYNENLSLEEAAAIVNISPQYFSKVIKKSTGFNFVDWLCLIRIRKAKEMLLIPNVTVKEVCYQVGYRDPNYFSRIFKKRVGVTPSEYQRLSTGVSNT